MERIMKMTENKELIAQYRDKSKTFNMNIFIAAHTVPIFLLIYAIIAFMHLHTEFPIRFIFVFMYLMIYGLLIIFNAIMAPVNDISIFSSRIILSRGLIGYPKYIIAKDEVINVFGNKVPVNQKHRESYTEAKNIIIQLIGNSTEDMLWIITSGRTFIVSCADATGVAQVIRELYAL